MHDRRVLPCLVVAPLRSEASGRVRKLDVGRPARPAIGEGIMMGR
jgi:hypothetical protein